MPNGDQPVISGTVIERSFVARDVATVLFAATAPLTDVSAKAYEADSDLLRTTVAQLVGVPVSTIIDELEYNRLVQYLFEVPNIFPPFPEFKDWWEWRQTRLEEVAREIGRADVPTIRMFAEHAIALFASTTGPADRGPWDFIDFSRSLEARQTQSLSKLELDEDAARVGLACFRARVSRTSKVAALTENVLRYDLPFGQSPATSSDSLLKLLQSGKKMCLAPIAAGGALGVAQLGQGQYLAALLAAGTGSVMTLILLSGVAVGSLLISHVAQGRTGGGGDERRRPRRLQS